MEINQPHVTYNSQSKRSVWCEKLYKKSMPFMKRSPANKRDDESSQEPQPLAQ